MTKNLVPQPYFYQHVGYNGVRMCLATQVLCTCFFWAGGGAKTKDFVRSGTALPGAGRIALARAGALAAGAAQRPAPGTAAGGGPHLAREGLGRERPKTQSPEPPSKCFTAGEFGGLLVFGLKCLAFSPCFPLWVVGVAAEAATTFGRRLGLCKDEHGPMKGMAKSKRMLCSVSSPINLPGFRPGAENCPDLKGEKAVSPWP